MVVGRFGGPGGGVAEATAGLPRQAAPGATAHGALLRRHTVNGYTVHDRPVAGSHSAIDDSLVQTDVHPTTRCMEALVTDCCLHDACSCRIKHRRGHAQEGDGGERCSRWRLRTGWGVSRSMSSLESTETRRGCTVGPPTASAGRR